MSDRSASKWTGPLFWTVTGAFCLAMTGSGVASLAGLEDMQSEIVGLGYPAYMMTILGIAKLSGAAVVLLPGLPRLKEWAYAGFTIDLLGAAASHAFAGDPVFAIVKPLLVLGLVLASYFLRPVSRRLAG